MKYEDCKKMEVDLRSVGGNRPYSLEELVNEVICARRERFFEKVFSAKEKVQKMVTCGTFDAIAFCAATKDFYVNTPDKGFEGEMIYDVIAGNDWVLHCKTKITWESALPIAGGYLFYHTDVVPGEKVDINRLNAMTGTLFQIKVLKDELKPITFMDAIERDRASFKK